METIPICKSKDDGAVKPQEIPIKVCVIFYNIELCYQGCGEKNKFSCSHLIHKQPPEVFFKERYS